MQIPISPPKPIENQQSGVSKIVPCGWSKDATTGSTAIRRQQGFPLWLVAKHNHRQHCNQASAKS